MTAWFATRKCLWLGAIALALLTTGCKAAAIWPAWEGFKSAFLSEDGRVVDHSQSDLRTVSEGQAYGLFFALVAKDRVAFDALLKWTENNLSQGDLGSHLPAWLWGKQSENWGVIDNNSAADADLWIAYALLEASRVWCHQPYADKARTLGNLILSKESMEVSGLGLSILPGNVGFVLADGAVKLNPSYVPPFIMARFAHAWADETRWLDVFLASQRLLLKSAHTGVYPDWVLYRNGEMFLPENEQRGDYDAIRNYLWIGMGNPDDPTKKALLEQLKFTLNLLTQRQHMPEWIEPLTGKVSKEPGPAGFQMAMAPFLHALGANKLAKQFVVHGLKSSDKKAWLNYGYYNGALNLFAQGFLEQRYRFSTLGELMPGGEEVKACG